MSMKVRGKNFEKKVVRGTETVGRDVKKGVGMAGTKVAKGARTVGRDVKIAGKRVTAATRHGVKRAGSRLKAHRRAKA
jgi:hypothetical protein